MAFRHVFLSAALFVLAVDGAPAQPTSSADGLFSAAQAARGKALYFADCVACHGNELLGDEGSPELTGPAFLKHWQARPVGDLLGYISTNMPQGNAGSLGSAAYADILAFLLSHNHFAPGPKDLTVGSPILRSVKLGTPQKNHR